MSKSLKFALLFVFALFFSTFSNPASISAAATLTQVGNVNVEGSSFAHLWYTGTTPTLSGTTTPGTSVSVSVDGQAAAAIVDAAGNWSYPLSLTTGDHQISLSTAGVVFSTFTLTIGNEVPSGTLGSDPNSDVSTLPVTGAFETTLLIVGAGLLLLIGSRFLPKSV